MEAKMNAAARAYFAQALARQQRVECARKRVQKRARRMLSVMERLEQTDIFAVMQEKRPGAQRFRNTYSRMQAGTVRPVMREVRRGSALCVVRSTNIY